VPWGRDAKGGRHGGETVAGGGGTGELREQAKAAAEARGVDPAGPGGEGPHQRVGGGEDGGGGERRGGGCVAGGGGSTRRQGPEVRLGGRGRSPGGEATQEGVANCGAEGKGNRPRGWYDAHAAPRPRQRAGRRSVVA